MITPLKTWLPSRSVMPVAVAFLTIFVCVFSIGGQSLPKTDDRQTSESEAEAEQTALSLFNYGFELRLNGGRTSLEEAKQKFSESAKIFQKLRKQSDQAKCFLYIGSIEQALGDSEKALEAFRRALSLSAIEDKMERATALNNIGVILGERGDYSGALDAYQKALPIFRSTDDRVGKEGHAMTLNNIGAILSGLGEYRKALEYFQTALSVIKTSNWQTVTRLVEERRIEALTLGNIGTANTSLNLNTEALQQHELALAIYREIGDTRGEAATLNNIGATYSALGMPRIGLEYFMKSLGVRKEAEVVRGESLILSNHPVTKVADEAFPFSRQVKMSRSDGVTLNNIGRTYLGLGKSSKALEFHTEAFKHFRDAGDLQGQAATLNYLMVTRWSMGDARLAIFYGKQSVNMYQELRAAISKLARDTQSAYRESVVGAYRRLADILISEGRFAEAQQVLDMLKEEEFSGYVKRDAAEIKSLSLRADLRPDEKAALEKYEQLAGKIAEYGAALMKLEELKRSLHDDFTQQAEYDDLKSKLDAANSAFRIFLEKGLAAELPKSVRKEIEFDRALQGRLAQWGQGTVALYTILGEDRYRVILTTPKAQIDGKYEIKAADLNKKIFAFREALQNPSIDPRPLGKELYDILIKPVEDGLKGADAKTLIWSLDGALRYIPIGTLSPDGLGYMAERYRNVVVTSTIRQNISSSTSADWNVLGAGVTKESTVKDPLTGDPVMFRKLDGVDGELRSIVREKTETRGALVGRRLLDDEFDRKSLGVTLSERRGDSRSFNVLHLATHFRLGADNSRSFLLLGKNKALTLAEISDDSNLDFTDFELVTLSACETAFGTAVENKTGTTGSNGAEVDSLATFIELRGAKAVMASLWPVVDESTSLLMTEFYRLKAANPSMNKADALQQAQLAMISGKLKSSGAGGGCRSNQVKTPGASSKDFTCDSNAPYSHPYFWSPFVLIGNWR